MIRGRVLLGAHVSGITALWIRAQIDEAKVADGMSYFRGKGRPDLAAALNRDFAQLREAERQYLAQRDDASADGSAEVVQAEVRPKSSRDLLTTTDAASALGVSTRRVRQLRADGSLAATWVGSQWLVERASVDELLARRELKAS